MVGVALWGASGPAAPAAVMGVWSTIGHMVGNPLLRSQKNNVFAVIQSAGLNPSDFAWVEWGSRFGGGYTVPVLLHSSSGYSFQFDRHPQKGQCVSFSPGDGKFEESEIVSQWYQVVDRLEYWLKCLEAEVTQPELWETIVSEKRLITNVQPGASDDAPFNRDELKRIDKSLGEMKLYLASTQNLNEQQTRIVNARLDYLGEAARRMGRKDWIVLVTGVLTNIAVSAAFAPSTTHELFRFAGQVLNWIFSHKLFLPM